MTELTAPELDAIWAHLERTVAGMADQLDEEPKRAGCHHIAAAYPVRSARFVVAMDWSPTARSPFRHHIIDPKDTRQ